MTLAILLIGLVAATCVIAYWADNLGKKLGKKRVSLFGLRPRQTATLISMASSVGIMIFTFGFLMLTSKSLTNALLYYDTVRQQANSARKDAEAARLQAEAETQRARTLATALESEIASKRRLIVASNKVLEKSQSRLRNTSTRLRQTQTLLAQAQQSKNAAQREAARAVREVLVAQRSAQSAKARFDKTQRELSTQRTRLIAAQSQFQKARQNLGAMRGALASTREQLEDAKDKQLEASNRLQEARGQFTKINDDFKRAETGFKKTFAQYNEAVTNLTKVQTELAQKKTEYDELSRQTLLVAAFAHRAQEIAGVAYGDVAFREGDVFAEKIIAPKTPPLQVRQMLHDLLEAGRANLQAENDKNHKNANTSDAAETSEKENKISLVLQPLPLVVGGKNVYLQGDEIINQLANYLSTFDVPVSVRLAAARAHASAEREIEVRFFPVPVQVVFRENEVLAETTISASASDARVFNQLLALMNEGEAAARAKGVMPVISTANQFFYAGGTNERIFEALHRIQALNAPARVRLVAAQDLTTVEPLHVRIGIDRETGSDLAPPDTSANAP